MISKQDVQHIAKLARIKLAEKEVEKFQREFSLILDYFNLLKEVDVSSIEPTFHKARNYFREDKAASKSSEVVNKLIEAAPQKKGRHIKVKSIF